MDLTERQLWTVVHGMLLGATFLLAFAGGLAGLWSLRPEYLTPGGLRERLPRLEIGTWVMAVVAWLTVITGTWIVYPWYRAGARATLLASDGTAGWDTFAMEWKEHIAWVAPILATAVSFVVLYYGARLAEEPGMRRMLMRLFILAFLAAAVAGLLGSFIHTVAQVE